MGTRPREGGFRRVGREESKRGPVGEVERILETLSRPPRQRVLPVDTDGGVQLRRKTAAGPDATQITTDLTFTVLIPCLHSVRLEWEGPEQGVGK